MKKPNFLFWLNTWQTNRDNSTSDYLKTTYYIKMLVLEGMTVIDALKT